MTFSKKNEGDYVKKFNSYYISTSQLYAYETSQFLLQVAFSMFGKKKINIILRSRRWYFRIIFIQDKVFFSLTGKSL